MNSEERINLEVFQRASSVRGRDRQGSERPSFVEEAKMRKGDKIRADVGVYTPRMPVVHSQEGGREGREEDVFPKKCPAGWRKEFSGGSVGRYQRF